MLAGTDEAPDHATPGPSGPLEVPGDRPVEVPDGGPAVRSLSLGNFVVCTSSGTLASSGTTELRPWRLGSPNSSCCLGAWVSASTTSTPKPTSAATTARLAASVDVPPPRSRLVRAITAGHRTPRGGRGAVRL